MRHSLSYRGRLESSNAEVTRRHALARIELGTRAPRARVKPVLSEVAGLPAETNFYSNRDAILPHRKPLTMHERRSCGFKCERLDVLSARESCLASTSRQRSSSCRLIGSICPRIRFHPRDPR